MMTPTITTGLVVAIGLASLLGPVCWRDYWAWAMVLVDCLIMLGWTQSRFLPNCECGDVKYSDVRRAAIREARGRIFLLHHAAVHSRPQVRS